MGLSTKYKALSVRVSKLIKYLCILPLMIGIILSLSYAYSQETLKLPPILPGGDNNNASEPEKQEAIVPQEQTTEVEPSSEPNGNTDDPSYVQGATYNQLNKFRKLQDGQKLVIPELVDENNQ